MWSAFASKIWARIPQISGQISHYNTNNEHNTVASCPKRQDFVKLLMPVPDLLLINSVDVKMKLTLPVNLFSVLLQFHRLKSGGEMFFQ